MKLLLVLLGLLAISSIFLFKYKSSDAYDEYKMEFNKNYSNSVDEYRRAIYFENVAKIEAWNSNPHKTYTQGINQFTDMTQEEFEKTFLGLENVPKRSDSYNDYGMDNGEDVDWTDKGEPFNKVKDQGMCGSCWAFSAVGGLEGLNKIKLDKTNYFSEQMLVDCSRSYGNYGCSGGLMTYAYDFVKDNGMVEEKDYKYAGVDQSCKIKTGPFHIDSYTEISSCNQQIEQLQVQPIPVACDASNWSSYKSGVFSNCGKSLNHGITLVGYKSGEYWKIKNSWGSSWGEQGFIRLKTGNTCGVCDMSCYPEKPHWD